MNISIQNINSIIFSLLEMLRKDRGAASHWTGTLSASALSTATAISALELVRRSLSKSDPVLEKITNRIATGLCWLAKQQNEDGGFGDTDRSPSNISTTALVLAAWKLVKISGTSQHVSDAAISKAEQFFVNAGAWAGLKARYGKDKTFVVPILTNCALAGMVPWSHVPQLPFPAACLPQSWYRFMRLPVVSYAIPALVAIGQVRFHHQPPTFPPLRWTYQAAVEPSLRVLQKIQPDSGGYLEATPLTSFVLMSLASMGRAEHPVARQAVQFLIDSALPDGSWPIDTNLATWVTSLAIGGIANLSDVNVISQVPGSTIGWLLDCQCKVRHPFTGAAPFGWGWSNLSGAVPDGDDTPAALIALARWKNATGIASVSGQSLRKAAIDGIGWLLDLQNRDGGWPTFCRGWGTLPFDRSGADLTAHALRAIDAWREELPDSLVRRTQVARDRGWRYLGKVQRQDGSWLPLWFGNHNEIDDENPSYGTAKVLIAAGHCGWSNRIAIQRAEEYLIRRQNSDGGWGGGADVGRWLQSQKRIATQNGVQITSSMEETAVCLEGLIATGGLVRYRLAIIRALDWLTDAVRQDRCQEGWPIGFYFAKLWYHERLYPTLFTLSALAELRRALLETSYPVPAGIETFDG